MRVAVCLAGLASGSSRGASNCFEDKYRYLFETISYLNPDFFIHSWNVEMESRLQELFKPKAMVLEPQRPFTHELKTMSPVYQSGLVFRTYSCFFSRWQSAVLKANFEQTNGFVYDLVILARFDVGYHNNRANRTSYLPKPIPTTDLHKIYSADWNQLNHGPSDHWFISSSENIDFIAAAYHSLSCYFSADSEYHKACVGGWPYSDANNEFSNEIFAANPKHTYTYKRSEEYSNNHLVYKYYLVEHNKWNSQSLAFV